MTTTTAERYQNTELAAITEQFTARERELDREIAAATQKLEAASDAHFQRWGGFDPDHFFNGTDADVRAYRAACHALASHQRPIREHLQTLKAQKSFLPLKRQQAVRGVLESITLGPSIPVPEVIVPSRSHDPALTALISKRDAAIAKRQAHERDLVELEALVPTQEEIVARLARHYQHKLATPAEVERENQRLDALQASISAAGAARATLDRTITELEREIENRQHEFEEERLEGLKVALVRAAFQMADDLARVMASSTVVKRLLNQTGAGRWMWTLEGLDADEGRGPGRELLERCLSIGWVPKTK